AEWCRHLFEEQRIGTCEREFDGRVVDLGGAARLAGDDDRAWHRFVQLAVLGAVLDGEDDVVCAEGMPVRPLHSLAQSEGKLGRVRVDLPTLGDVRQNL